MLTSVVAYVQEIYSYNKQIFDHEFNLRNIVNSFKKKIKKKNLSFPNAYRTNAFILLADRDFQSCLYTICVIFSRVNVSQKICGEDFFGIQSFVSDRTICIQTVHDNNVNKNSKIKYESQLK